MKCSFLLMCTLSIYITIPLSGAIEADKIDGKNDLLKYRLPEAIIPKHYVVKLSLDFFSFNGFVTILTIVRQETNQIFLHIDNIEYKNITLTSKKIDKKISNITHDEEHQLLQIITEDTLLANSYLSINIEYTGYLTGEKNGLYKNFYIDNFNETKWYAVTYLEPIGARRVFPCFDEPGMRATFELIVGRAEDFRTVSITNISETKKGHDGIFFDIFEKTEKIPPYILSFIVSEFNSSSAVLPNFAWINQAANYNEAQVYNSKIYFDTLSQNRNLKEFYALNNQLENWGIVAYNSTTIFTNPDYVSFTSNLKISRKSAYEIAYEWFAINISPYWWNDGWLNIGYSEYYSFAHALFDPLGYKYFLQYEKQYVVEKIQPSFLIDALPSTLPLSYNVYTPSEIAASFDTHNYVKSASILRMFSYSVTSFWAIENPIYKYVKRQKNSAMNLTEYGNFLNKKLMADNYLKKYNVSLQTIINSWVTQAGFPVVHVKRNDKTVTLSQKEYIIDYLKTNESGKVWYIPISWTTSLRIKNVGKEKYVKYLLTNTSETITIDSITKKDWMIFNDQQIGYYRVNYDQESWMQIINLLNSNNFCDINEINRASLLDDLFNLARAGYVNYSTAFSASQYLINEEYYIPWKAAFNNFAFLQKKIRDENIKKSLEDHLLTIMEPVYKNLVIENTENEVFFDILLRTNIVEWACKLGHEDCLLSASNMFNDWKNNPLQLVPVNDRQTIFCTVVKHGSDDNWEFLWNKYFETNIQIEKNTIIGGLACSKNKSKLQQLLSLVLRNKSQMRLEDRLTLFSSVYSSGLLGAIETLKFINQNFDKLFFDDYEDEHTIEKILNGVLLELITEESILQFEKFVSNHSEQLEAPIKQSLNLSIAQAYNELKWYDTYHSDIAAYFYLPDSNHIGKLIYEEIDAGDDNGDNSGHMSQERTLIGILAISYLILYFI